MKRNSKRNSMLKGLTIAVLISLGLLLIGGYVLLTAVVQPIFNLMNATPEPAPTYTPATVSEVCRLLAINFDDPFCRKVSGQNGKALKNALYRNFPPNTTYEQIMPLLKSLQSISTEKHLQGEKFTANGCEIPVETIKNYDECMVIFPENVRMVWIRFISRKVIDYTVSGAE